MNDIFVFLDDETPTHIVDAVICEWMRWPIWQSRQKYLSLHWIRVTESTLVLFWGGKNSPFFKENTEYLPKFRNQKNVKY